MTKYAKRTFKPTVAWHMLVINDVIVAAGSDLLIIMGRQVEEETKRKALGKAAMLCYFAKTKKAAVYTACADRRFTMCYDLQQELALGLLYGSVDPIQKDLT